MMRNAQCEVRRFLSECDQKWVRTKSVAVMLKMPHALNVLRRLEKRGIVQGMRFANNICWTLSEREKVKQ